MNQEYRAVCFSGPRTERLPQSEEAIQMLEEAVYEAIDAAVRAGFNTFIHGACYGFDLLCAEQILIRRRVIKPDDPREIKVVAAIPFEDQAARWKGADRDRYFDILKQCDEVITLSAHYHSGCYYERNQWMVDRSRRLICYSDGNSRGTADTVRRAQAVGLEIVNLYR